MSFFTDDYAPAIAAVTAAFDWGTVDTAVRELVDVRAAGGRVFVLGLGGSAGNASHMVNDLRKLTGIEAYTPTDNVSELTARINDDGWGKAFAGWLEGSRLSEKDAIFVLSVGGGDAERGVSTELVAAIDFAASRGSRILGIVGRDGGHAGRKGRIIVVPTARPDLITPLSEAFQSVVWHGIVSHPELAVSRAHWESLDGL